MTAARSRPSVRLGALTALVVTLSFTMQAQAGLFQINAMSGDATSGISSSKTYTHAFDLNRGGTDPLGGNDALALTINGVLFSSAATSAGGTDALHGGSFTATGMNATFNGHNPGVTGGAGDLIDDFFHNGNGNGGATPGTEVITLTGLTAGQVYKTVFYVGGFGTNAQDITFSDNGATYPGVPRNGGLSPGARLEYTFVASGAGSMTYTFDAQSNGDSFHQYGFTNEVVTGVTPIAGLFNTGVDNSGAVLGDSVNDPHYAIILQPAPGGLTDTTIPADGFPIPPWVANSATSRWITPNTNDGNGPVGSYTYRTTFDLIDVDLSTVVIQGLWASDNGGTDILINGLSTGSTNGGFGSLTAFTINSGFVLGLNTLDFVLNNDGPPGPTGLRVEGLSGFANIAVPEPATGMLLVLAGGALLRRRRAA
ncbi:MAG: PEP-CTERM sorting domain-containing protein [Phycisphaeraceae bacterium]